jgi:hypothetical protein
MQLLIAAIAALAATISLARDSGQWSQADPSIKKWIEDLKDHNNVSCCNTADGFDVQWDTKDNRYRVYLYGEWHLVPPEAVLDIPNRLGAARVWYTVQWGPMKDGKQVPSKILIRCFLRGSLI